MRVAGNAMHTTASKITVVVRSACARYACNEIQREGSGSERGKRLPPDSREGNRKDRSSIFSWVHVRFSLVRWPIYLSRSTDFRLTDGKSNNVTRRRPYFPSRAINIDAGTSCRGTRVARHAADARVRYLSRWSGIKHYVGRNICVQKFRDVVLLNS